MSLSSSAPTVPRATVYLVNDGIIEGVDPKDRASMAAIMMPKGNSPTLAVFANEDLGIVSKLHQNATTKECDVVVTMFNEEESSRTLNLTKMQNNMLAFVPGLLGGSVPLGPAGNPSESVTCVSKKISSSTQTTSRPCKLALTMRSQPRCSCLIC